MLETKRPVHILDVMAGGGYQAGDAGSRALVDLGGARTGIGVPLLKDEAVLGFIMIYRQEVRAFSEKEIALLQNFATQAVIAMENARLWLFDFYLSFLSIRVCFAPYRVRPAMRVLLILAICGFSFLATATRSQTYDGTGSYYWCPTSRAWYPQVPTCQVPWQP